jgi:hypothetical protein
MLARSLLHVREGDRARRALRGSPTGGRGTQLSGRVALAGLVLGVTAICGGWTWSGPSPLGVDATYVHVAATGSLGATSVALGERANATTDAWISRGSGGSFTPLPAPASWSIPPVDSATGMLTPGSGIGCRAPSVASAPDGSVLGICLRGNAFFGAGPLLSGATLPAGGTTLEPLAVPLYAIGLVPVSMAIAGDGLLVASLPDADTSGHPDCSGVSWQGPDGDPARWSYLRAADGQGGSAAAGSDGSALVSVIAGHCDATPAGLPRVVVAARRGTASRWWAATLARNVVGSSFAAVAGTGRMAVAWAAPDPGYAAYGDRWASAGAAIRPAGSTHWTCRPIVGEAACTSGNARDRAQHRGSIGNVRAARIYGLVALPDSSFVVLFSGLTGRPAHAGGLYVSTIAPGATRWSAARLLDPDLFQNRTADGRGPATLVLDQHGALLVAWPHRVGTGQVSLRVERLDRGAEDFTFEADVRGQATPRDARLVAPADGPPSLLWIDAVADRGMGGLLVASAGTPPA